MCAVRVERRARSSHRHRRGARHEVGGAASV